jgi:hypothetical protein
MLSRDRRSWKKGRHFDTLLSCKQGMRFQAADDAAWFAAR